MRTFKCPNCSFQFTDADKEWDLAVQSGTCPKCRKKHQHLNQKEEFISSSNEPIAGVENTNRSSSLTMKKSFYLSLVLIYLAFYIPLRLSHAFVHYESIKKCGRAWQSSKYEHCHRVEFRRMDVTAINFIINLPVKSIGYGLEILYFPITQIEGAYWQSKEIRSITNHSSGTPNGAP